MKLLSICLGLCLLLAAPASAHRNRHGGGPSVKVIASGLDNPRHVAVAKNGDVYVVKPAAAAIRRRRNRASTAPKASPAPAPPVR